MKKISWKKPSEINEWMKKYQLKSNGKISLHRCENKNEGTNTKKALYSVHVIKIKRKKNIYDSKFSVFFSPLFINYERRCVYGAGYSVAFFSVSCFSPNDHDQFNIVCAFYFNERRESNKTHKHTEKERIFSSLIVIEA